jgi:phosphotransferase system  glucose/maltose/N-acetylglucosamine-specific IIC component
MSNPFAMPDANSLPVMETRSVVRLKRVGVVSAGMISGVLGAIGGLLGGGMFFLFSLLVGLSPQNNNQGAAAVGAGIGVVIFAPLLYGAAGFIGGVIYAFIYNILAGMTGGLQMEFSRD